MCQAKVVSQKNNQLKIEVTIKLDSSSMLQSEDNIVSALNNAGCLAVERALKQFDLSTGQKKCHHSKCRIKIELTTQNL